MILNQFQKQIANNFIADCQQYGVQKALEYTEQNQIIEAESGQFQGNAQDLKAEYVSDEDANEDDLKFDGSVSKLTYDKFNQVMDTLILKSYAGMIKKLISKTSIETECIIDELKKQKPKKNGYKEKELQIKYKFAEHSSQVKMKKFKKNKDLALLSLTKNTLLFRKHINKSKINLIDGMNKGIQINMMNSVDKVYKSLDPQVIGKYLSDNNQIINRMIISNFIRYYFDETVFVSERRLIISNENAYSKSVINQVQQLLRESQWNQNKNQVMNMINGLSVRNKQKYQYYIKVNVAHVDKLSQNVNVEQMCDKLVDGVKLVKILDKTQKRWDVYKKEVPQIIDIINE